MEITELNLMAGFEAGIICLQNPSPLSRFSSILSVDKLPRFSNFWKWGARIIALLATFTRLICRLQLFILRNPPKSVVSCQQSCSQQIYDDDDFDYEVSDDEEDDDTSSSVADSHDESEDYQKPSVEVFRAEGCSFYCGNDRGQEDNDTLRQRNGFLWSKFSAGESVVKLWDSVDSEDDGSEHTSDVEIWEINRDVIVNSGHWWRRPVAAANVVVSTEINEIDGVGFYGDSKTPAIYAAWPPGQRKKAYVQDNGADVVSVTESDWETW